MRQRQDKRARKNGPALFWEKLRQRRGDFTLNSAFMLLFVMILLVLSISTLGTINDAMKLHSVAADLTRYIEIRGQVDTQVYTEMARLANIAGVTIDHYTINTFGGGTKVQFGSSFTVTLETTAHLGVGGVLSVPVPLRSTVSGRGERYWKV